MIKKYGSVIYSAVITSGLFLVLYAIAGFYPFGEGLVSWCDMNQQTIPLINTFKDIFANGSGIFQNFNHAGGMDFYGVFFFFVASPFNLLTLFIDKADIPQFMNILVMLKLSVAGASASYFFCKRYKDSSVILKTVLSVSYAFCGYGMMFYQNIIWLDIMILFPLLLLSCYSLLENGKLLPITVVLTLCVIINYYISFMLFLFLILFFGIKGLFKKVERSVYIKLGISAVSSLLISAVVWMPSFMQYTSSARGESLIDGLQSAGFFTHYETTIPIILCSALSLCIVLFAAFSGNLKQHKDKFIIILLMLVPLIIEPINMMWHTGNYMSFPARYAFITIFLLTELCAEVINDIKECDKSRISYAVAGIILSVICGGFLLWYTEHNFYSLINYTSTLWGSSQSFEGILTAFIIAFIVFAVLFALLKYKKITKRIFALAVAVIVLCESVCSVGIYVLSTNDKFDNENYQKVLAVSDDLTDDSFYRVNMSQKYTDANQLGGFSLNTIGHYTSLNSASFMEAAKMMGYSGYWMEINSAGGSLLSNALLGIKYTLKRDYDGEYFFGENKVFPSVIFSDTEFTETLSGERLTALDNALLSATGQSVVTKYLSDSGVEHRVANDLYEGEIIRYKVSVTEPTVLYIDCYNGFSNNLTEPINEALTVYADGIYVTGNYPTQHSNGLLCLGEYQYANLEISIKLNKNICASSFGVFGIDVNKFNAVCEGIQGVELQQDGGTLYGNIPENAPQNILLSVPYKDGMNITIGGKAVQVKKALTGFITFNTNGLSGELEISYTPKGFYLALVLSIIGVLAFTVIMILQKRKIPEFLEKSASLLFKVVFTVFYLVIYILPIIINITA